jgi:flavin-binding protein dodecin
MQPLDRQVFSIFRVRVSQQLIEVRKMSVAKVTEIISASSVSFEDAVKIGVKRADKTLKNVRSAWVKEQKVSVKDGKIVEYRVTLKVTFVLND